MLGRDFEREKKTAQLVIPVRSTFQNGSHPPIGGPHPVLYFTNQIKKKYCTAMCYISTGVLTLPNREYCIGKNVGQKKGLGIVMNEEFVLPCVIHTMMITKYCQQN